MATQTIARYNGSTLLRRAFQLDGLFSAIFGLAFIVGVGPVGSFLGLDNILELELFGIGVLLYGAALLWQVSRTYLERRAAFIIPVLNFVWAIGSYVLIFANWLPLTTEGKWAIGIQAEVVGILGIVQLYAAWKANKLA
jgi:hypothetical protein